MKASVTGRTASRDGAEEPSRAKLSAPANRLRWTGQPRLARFGLPPTSGPHRDVLIGLTIIEVRSYREDMSSKKRHGLRIERDVADLDHDERDPATAA